MLFSEEQAGEASELVGRFEKLERKARRAAASDRATESLGQAVRELSLSNQSARHVRGDRGGTGGASRTPSVGDT